jgi:hypothetical protein
VDEAGSLRLDAAAADLLTAEAGELLRGLRGGEARARFLALAEQVAAGEVGEEAVPALEQLLALGLETGRILKVHGRAADTLARGLYARTPAGRARAAQAAAVTAALAAFAGARLDSLTVAADGPSGYRLTLATDRGEAVVRVGREGATVDSVAVG